MRGKEEGGKIAEGLSRVALIDDIGHQASVPGISGIFYHFSSASAPFPKVG